MSNMSELISVADLSASEKLVVEQFLSSREQLDDLIPDNMENGDLWSSLAACCKTLSLYRKSSSMLKMIVGRLLVVLQDRPELYRDLGYQTYDQFLTRGMPELFGIPRSEAYAARALVAKWPSLSVDQIKQVSYSKLALISHITEESAPDANKYLALAQNHTLDQLKDVLANSGIMPREDSDMCSITLLATKGVKDEWLEFINDPTIRAYVGSDNPSVILSCMIGEVSAEWRGKALLNMAEADGTWSAAKA